VPVYSPLHPDGAPALLQIPGLIHDQDPVGGAEVIDDEGAQLAGDRVGVPHGAGQQVLHAPRPVLAGGLGQRPAVARPLPAQQRQHHRAQPGPRLRPGDVPTNTLEQLIDVAAPGRGSYPVQRGHRRGVRSPHTFDAARWPPRPWPAAMYRSDLQLQY
jgi:hypothetical protein